MAGDGGADTDRPRIPLTWDTIYAYYRDPPAHRYQAIEVKEHLPTGDLLMKTYGGHGDGGWLEVYIPKAERERFGRALLGEGTNDERTAETVQG